MSTIAEERAYNPRLQVAGEQAYVALMGSLKLDNPKWMDVAVPANLACGKRA
jgi:sulfur dioxygenase